eukprot:6235146-Alexandrium_andersonii.AAC.1
MDHEFRKALGLFADEMPEVAARFDKGGAAARPRMSARNSAGRPDFHDHPLPERGSVGAGRAHGARPGRRRGLALRRASRH